MQSNAVEYSDTLPRSALVPADVRDGSAAALATLMQRAKELHTGGERHGAESLYKQILQRNPNQPDALHLLGLVEHEKQNFQNAVLLIQRAVGIDSSRAAFFMDLGSAFRGLGNLRKAAESYVQAISLNPQSAETFVNLGNTFKDGQQFDDAVACYRQAIALKPGLIGAHENLGNVLRNMCRFEEALTCYQNALALNSNKPSTIYNLALLMCDLGKLDEALVHFKRCLELEIAVPDRVLLLQAQVELLRGDFETGWNHYERRWGSPDHDTPNRSFAQPMWSGEKLSQGSLFIWGEQGIGDEIMFAGLVPDVLRITNSCILECDGRLRPLFARSFPSIAVVSRPATRVGIEFEAHIPSGSLPRILRSSHSAFCSTPLSYLVADEVQRQMFRADYYDGRPLIGLTWKTKSKKSGHLRSIDLSMLAALFADGNSQVVSLQYGDPEELSAEAKAAGLSLRVDREVDQFSDVDRFAAQIAAMDLVITIDNSTAHLAGAMGVTVWLLLPLTPDWRWQLDREDSPWYPSMRIFRQQHVLEWKPVLDRVQNALKQFGACQ